MVLKIPGIGLAKGLAISLKHVTRKRITQQYPEQKLCISRRTRSQELVWDSIRCTGCATCVKACPQGNIRIVTSKGENNDYVVDEFENDEGRCMFCGLCIEVCPFEALFFGTDYERSQYRRSDLIATKEDMSAPGQERSAYSRPDLHDKLPSQTLLIDRIHKRIL